MGKSFLLALYSMLRALLCPGSRIAIVGAAFRQSKVVFDYCSEIWDNAPILRDIVGEGKFNGPRRDVDRCTLRMGESLIVALPLGTGEKIRGQRANIILADEFGSIPIDIFETVVRGFGAVSLSPIEVVERESRTAALRELGLWNEAPDGPQQLMSNQTIISGTAYYSFNHFYSYWLRYKQIIESRGDRHKLAEVFGGEDKIDPDFNWKDFSVIRIPVGVLPKGFMDAKTVASARATVHLGIYAMEYEACFQTDSNGFFKRSLVESCVVGKNTNPITHASCGLAHFTAALKGDPSRWYVMGVDPASEKDNFSIVVLECWPDHRRIVHCWTTTRKRHVAKVKKGLVQENDFYGYCARKIRDLAKTFPCRVIALDSQGGGIGVMEALHDKDKLREGEEPIWPIVDPEKPQDSDGNPGRHILEMVQFANADWVGQANHGMKKDFEDRALLFPYFDAISIVDAFEDDKAAGRIKEDSEGAERLYDSLEDCVLEIEKLKDELAIITHTQTGVAMRDRWDTPETKEAGGKKGRLRKDRYSSLLMANMASRLIMRAPKAHEAVVGGFAHEIIKHGKGKGTQMYSGPSWFTEPISDGPFGVVVRRKGR